jgi:hypothetical protein
MNLIPYLAVWSAFALAVLALALYRKILTAHGDDEFVHLAESEQRLIPHQVALGRKLELIDRWGKILTISTGVFGFAIACLFFYQVWQASLQTN